MIFCNFSEANGWTSSKTPFKMNQTSICIKIAAQYLPDGKEDETKIQVGTRIFENDVEMVSISLWKNNRSVFVSYAGIERVIIRGKNERQNFCSNSPK